MMTTISALCLVIICIGFGIISANHEFWTQDIESSLKTNIVGCKWQTYTVNVSIQVTNQTDEFFVRTMTPTRHEIALFRKFPATLTQGNKDLADLMGKSVAHEKEKAIMTESLVKDQNACLNHTKFATLGKPVSIYEEHKAAQRAFYVMHARNALIHPSGSVALECGYFVGNEGCENKAEKTKVWYDKCKSALAKEHWDWGKLWDQKESSKKRHDFLNSCLKRSELGIIDSSVPQVTTHDKVFTIPTIWDDDYHHFITNSLVRLARNFRYLKAHPDVMIHIYAYEEFESKYANDKRYKARAKAIRNEFLSLLGIKPERIVWGAVLAREVFVPRFMQCSFSISNPAELRLLNKQLMIGTNQYLARQPDVRDEIFNQLLSGIPDPKGARLRTQSADMHITAQVNGLNISSQDKNDRTKVMAIYQEYSDGKSNDHLWSDSSAKAILKTFANTFPRHQVFIVSSKKLGTKEHCLACDIALIAHADVFVAMHGRALTNMIFLKPGAVVVEIVGSVNSKHMPLCGYYGPMAAGLGLHHYIYAYDHKSGKHLDSNDLASQSFEFYQSASQHNNANLATKITERAKEMTPRASRSANSTHVSK